MASCFLLIVFVSSEEFMFKCKFSRLELSLRRVQFMLQATCVWVAAGETPRGAHQGADEAVFGELHAFVSAFTPRFYSSKRLMLLLLIPPSLFVSG